MCDHQPTPAQWDDEQEFDAVTETLHAKHIHVVACQPGQPDPALVTLARNSLADVALQTAFASLQTLPTAEAIWQGRAVAPHFFKLRMRDTLDDDVAAFLFELLRQNWKVELDYGLGGGTDARESLLVVASAPVTQQLVSAATGATPSSVPPLMVIETQGALVESGQSTLEDLRSILAPRCARCQ